jgi:hypothetical protein
MPSYIERVINKKRLLCVIIREQFRKEGIEFFTPQDFSQQIAFMSRPEGYYIEAHLHNPVTREVHFTNEVLFIKKGKVRVDFYDDTQSYLESKILCTGDIILLSYGGHGLKMLEKSEIIEVKQGPYAGEQDKRRFEGVGSDMIIIKE